MLHDKKLYLEAKEYLKTHTVDENVCDKAYYAAEYIAYADYYADKSKKELITKIEEH